MAEVMSQARKRQKIDFETEATFEDLPHEITLKIFELVNIKDLFRCMAVNKRLRAIANDQSLWNKMHLTGEDTADIFPAEMIQEILARGCQYFSFFESQIMKTNVRFNKNFQLKYLCIVNCLEYDCNLKNPWDSFDILPDLAASCHSLEKLSIRCIDSHLKFDDEAICKDTMELRINRIEAKFFKCIIQNCETLRVLDLSHFDLSLESVQRIISLCQELIELNIRKGKSEDIVLCEKSVDFICNHLTTKIEKLDISCQSNFGDGQFKTLIRRCNKLTELELVGTSITEDSVGTIVESLSQTLVKLNGCEFSFHKHLELASMPKLQVLAGSCTIDEKQNRIIEKMLPNMTGEEFVGGPYPHGGFRFSMGDFGITEPYPHSNWHDYERYGLVPNGFWEIKAKQRTYNGFSKLCKSCGVVCKCAN